MAAQRANLVLPSFMRYEDKFSYSYSLDGSLVRFEFAFPAPSEARSTCAILVHLAKFLGMELKLYDLPLFKRIFNVSPHFTISPTFLIPSWSHQEIHNLMLPDVTCRASTILNLANNRFSKAHLVRNNYANV